jgi:hypothetical protein
MSNPETENFDDEYFELLSEYGKSTFRELISDLSRQRQTNLLVSALITILLTFSIVGNVETEFFGLKFVFTNPNIIPIVTGAICFYFLLTYLVGVYQDWQHTRFSTLPTKINILNLSNKISLAQLERINKRVSFVKNIDETMAQTLQERSEIFKEINELEERQRAEADEENKKYPNAPGFGRMLLTRKHELERKPLYEKLVNFSKDNNLLRVAEKTKRDIHDTSLEGKANLLGDARRKYQTLNTINVIIQIVFPSMLAIFAIGAVVWRLWH